MMRGRVVVAAITVVLLLATAGAGGAAVADGFGQEQVDPDDVVLGVALQPDGDAHWTVEYRIRLSTDEETAAFADLQSDIHDNSSAYTSEFATRMERTAATAADATGREMSVQNVTVTAEQRTLPQDYGVITYQFEWTNFAAVDGESVRAGDALAGFFLDSDTSLRLSWPDGYTSTGVSPDPDQTGDRSVIWHGPKEFGSEEPSVVVGPVSEASDDGAVEMWWVVGAGILAAGLLVGIALLARRRRDGSGQADDSPGPVEASVENGDTATGNGADDTPSDGVPSELLSNEERVLQLLAANDGRLKQQAVAERLDWTAAKTSQVIGSMRDDNAVETFRLGRENVVTLPDRGLGDDLGPDDSQ